MPEKSSPAILVIKERQQIVSAVFLSVNIFDYFFRRGAELGGLSQNKLQHFQSGSIVEAVANSFVAYKAYVNILILVYGAVGIYLVLSLLCAESYKLRAGSEIVQVVEYCGYAQRAHRGYEHRAVEGTDLLQEFGKKVEIIQGLQKPNGEFQKQCGNVAEPASCIVKITAGIISVIGNSLFHFLIHFFDRVGGLEYDLDDRVGGVDAHFLLYGKGDLNGTAGPDSLSSYKAVKLGTLRDKADVSGDDNMHESQVLHALLALLLYVFVNGNGGHGV